MNKERALEVLVTALVRELLREDAPGATVSAPGLHAPEPDDPNPRPQFDFDESVCEHGGLVIDRSVCPIHGPEAMGPPPTAEELDDIVSETHDEANPLIARARRLKERQARQQAQQGLYPEDLPMSGLAGPTNEGPPLVV